MNKQPGGQSPLRQSEYTSSRSMPSQAFAKKCTPDQPVRTIILQEKSQLSMKGNSAQQRIFGKVRDIENITDRGKKLKYTQNASLERTIQRHQIPRDDSLRARQENVHLIEQYESRLSQVILESQTLQDQHFTDQQRFHKMLSESEMQVKNLDMQVHSERNTAEQLRLLISSKNDEVRAVHREIEQLERKCHEQQNMLMHMSQDIDRSKAMLENRNHEMDGWKGQQVERERNHMQEINRFKSESEFNFNLEQHNKDEVCKLEELIRLLRYELSERDTQQDIQQQLERATFETDNNHLEREIESLKCALNERDREIESYGDRFQQAERGHQQSMDDLRLHFEYVRKQMLEREMNEVIAKHQNERIIMETQHRQSMLRNNELDAKLQTILGENQKLMDRLRQRTEECESWRSKYLVQEVDHSKLSNQLDYMSKQEFTQQQETMILQRELQNLRTKLLQEEDRAAYLEVDNLKMNSLLHQYQIEHSQQLNQIESQYKQQILMEVDDVNRRANQEKDQFSEQVRVLMNQMNQLQDQFNAQLLELNQTRQQLLRTQGDLDTLKIKYNNLEQQRQIELTDYTQDFEASKQSLKDQLAKLNTEKSILENNSKHQKQKISDYENQRIQMEHKLNQNEQEIDELKQSQDSMLQKANHDKLNYEQNVNSLKDRLKQSAIDLQGLQIKLERSEQTLQDLQDQHERDRAQSDQQRLAWDQQARAFKQTISQLEQNLLSLRQAAEESQERFRVELQNQKDSYATMKRVLTEEINTIKGQMEHSQVKDRNAITEAQDEISRLNKLIKSLEKEILDKQRLYEDLETELSEEIEELQIQIEYFQKNQLDQKDWEMRFSAERTSLEAQISSLRIKYEDEMQRANTALSEVRRLEDILHQRLKEIDELRHKLGTNRLTDEEYEALQRKMASMHDEIYDMQQERLKLNNEKANHEKALVRLQNEVQSKDLEVQQVYELMNKRRSEQDALIREMDNLKKENQRMVVQIQDQNATIKGRQDQIEELKREKDESQQSNQLLKRQMTQQEEQNALKHKSMMDKIHELDTLKAKYEDQWKQGGGMQSSRMSIMKQSVVSSEDSGDKKMSASQARIARQSIRQSQS